MTRNADLLSVALDETMACQDPTSSEFLGRSSSQYGPWGPFLPASAGRGQCATTDRAMDAIARLAESVRKGDPHLRRAIASASVARETLNAFAELLPDLAREADGKARWRLLRARLLDRLAGIGIDLMHYIPVWLFVGQACEPIEVGPVRFVRRQEWPEQIAKRRGSPTISWLDTVSDIWADDRDRRKACARADGPLSGGSPETEGEPQEQPTEEIAEQQQARQRAERVARSAHPDQWVACIEVVGFEAEESRRRALLATRVALDAIRLLLPNGHRHRFRTSADHAAPSGVDRFRQAPGGELRWGGSVDKPGVSGQQGLAREIVDNGAAVLRAAGECIRQACTAEMPDASRLPMLS